VTARVLVGQQGRSTVLNYYGNCIAVNPEAAASGQPSVQCSCSKQHLENNTAHLEQPS
jgi:hypothetical protein